MTDSRITHYTLCRQQTGAVYVGFLHCMTDCEASDYCANGGDLYAWDTETINATQAASDYTDCEIDTVLLFRQTDHKLIWRS